MLVRSKRYGMKMININGKEYTKDEFWKQAEEHDTGRCLVGENHGYIEFLSEIFEELKSDFPRHEPEPPTVRPMSELPKGEEPFSALFVLEDKRGIRYYDIGFTTSAEFASIGNVVYSMEKSWRLEEFKILGWLYELPNPNDIKL